MTTGPAQLTWTPLKIAFIGCVEEGRRTLDGLVKLGEEIAAVFTFTPDKAAKVSGAARFDDITAEHGIPLHLVTSINSAEAVATMREIAPDVVFCVGWTQLLGSEILAIPRFGCLGFHASLLPTYRGRAPVNWALINGEVATGNTLMVLDEGVDTGDIVAQRAIMITDDDTCETVYDKVAATELEMISEVMPLFHLGMVPRRPQDHARATVVGRRRPEDGGITWNRSRREVLNWIRALTHPYPGAFTTVAGTKVFVWRARAEATADPHSRPGWWRLVDDPPRLLAGTSDGDVVIERVQCDGEEETDGVTFARRRLHDGGSSAHTAGEAEGSPT